MSDDLLYAADELPLYELLGRLQIMAPDDPAQALKVAEAALKSRGPSPWLYAICAVAHSALDRMTEALPAAREAVALAPDDAALILCVVPLLAQAKAEREALAALERVARREPDLPEAQVMLAKLWLAVGERDKAQAARDRLAALSPDDPQLPELDLALTAEHGVSPAYVRALFEGYADRFESDLVQKLQYVTPEVLGGMLEAALPADSSLVVCDAGCGTGLMARHLRPYAETLIGVDLSPRMLAQAERLGLYDELEAGELTEFLGWHEDYFDLIAAADVLVYLGDLTPFFAAATRSLRPAGRLLASVERSQSGDFILQETRRYAHSRDYLQRLCAVHGFVLEQLLEFQPRREGKSFIDGLAFLARRA